MTSPTVPDLSALSESDLFALDRAFQRKLRSLGYTANRVGERAASFMKRR